jgi:hypothetical protein
VVNLKLLSKEMTKMDLDLQHFRGKPQTPK